MKNADLKQNFKFLRNTVITLMITIFIGQLYRLVFIDGSSMEPTMSEGQIAVIDMHKEPKRGDIIVINSTALGKRIVKRVIAIEGDCIIMSGNQVWINGKRLEEKYLYSSTYKAEEEVVTVPVHGFYVLGDNRNHSMDSREFGIIYREEIIGVVIIYKDKKQEVFNAGKEY